LGKFFKDLIGKIKDRIWPVDDKTAYVKFYLIDDRITLDFCAGEDPVKFFLMLQEVFSGNVTENTYVHVAETLQEGGFIDEADMCLELIPEEKPLIDPTKYSV
jgi:hypothetical protein